MPPNRWVRGPMRPTMLEIIALRRVLSDGTVEEIPVSGETLCCVRRDGRVLLSMVKGKTIDDPGQGWKKMPAEERGQR